MHNRRLQEKQNNQVVRQTKNQMTPAQKALARQKFKKEIPEVAVPTPPANYAGFITGGIGDVFAVESFLSDLERKNLDTIYYATNKRKPVELLLRSVPSFSNLENHIVVWDDFTDFWCFFSLQDCLAKLANKITVPKELRSAVDLSIFPFFQKIREGRKRYHDSSFLNYKLTDIDEFKLPSDFLVVLPYSTDKRLFNRDFSLSDWRITKEFLDLLDIKAVIINGNTDPIPETDRFIDLSGKTTVTQAIEILKSSKGYWGVDSWLSVLAAKLFDNQWLQIKSVNKHCYDNAMCYYAPKTKFDFLKDKISLPNISLI